MKRKRIEVQGSYAADPPAWRFQAIVSLICGSPWFVSALLESHSNHKHIAWIMLLIGVGLGLLNFLDNYHSHSFEIGLYLFLASLMVCFLILPVFRKARDKAAHARPHQASFYSTPRVSGSVEVDART